MRCCIKEGLFCKKWMHCYVTIHGTYRLETAMMKKLLIVFLVLLSTFLWAATVFAWDDLINLSYSPFISSPGRGSGLATVRYGSSSEMFDHNGDKQDLGDT